MNDTVTGVLGGVLPKTCAPGSWAALTPAATAVGVFGPGLEAAAALEAATRRTMAAPAPASTPAKRRVLSLPIMGYTVLFDRDR
jgi:hypothetical protein